MKKPKITGKDLALAKRLQKTRKRLEVSQEELAVKTGFTQTYISLIEVGKRKASLKALTKITRALGIKVRDIIDF